MAPSHELTRELSDIKQMVSDLKVAVTAIQTSLAENRAYCEKMSGEIASLREEMKESDALHIKTINDVAALRKEVASLKASINEVEQKERADSIRVTGITVTEAEEEECGPSKAIGRKVYDRLLKPILTAARAKGDIRRVPAEENLIVSAFKLGKGWKNPAGIVLPPPIIVRFASVEMRNAVLKNKRLNMPHTTEEEKKCGIQSFGITENLTATCVKKIQEMKKDERVERVWTIDGRIRFTIKNSKSIFRLPSPYSDLEEVINIG